MAVLLRNVTNSIWHAFNALNHEQCGGVSKTKLKVLTANVATILDLYGVEKGLDHFRSTSTLSFEHFRFYLLQEVFTSLPASISLQAIRVYESKIEEICWLVCRKNYLPETSTPNRLNDDLMFKLFRIFCMLAELQQSSNDLCTVLIHSSEAALILQQLMSAMGIDYETDDRYTTLNESDESYRFDDFLRIIEINDDDSSEFTECTESFNEAIEEMYETYIKDIIKKGNLHRRGYLLPSLKEYWFVLQPCELSYYKNQNQKEANGSILLDSNCAVRPSTPRNGLGKHSDKFLRFGLSVGDRNFEFAVANHRSRLQWIAALQLAITYSCGREGYQRDLMAKRRKRRDVEHKRRRDDQMQRSKQLLAAEAAHKQLEQEKLARVAAETQAKQLQIVAREDSRRVAELEDVKQTLERLLEEETQAKRDEEIVRALQARVLAEEWEKREELEQLQEEQRTLLDQERQKRIEFEQRQKEKEQRLRDAEEKLHQLEDERKKLDTELRQARFKIRQSEDAKEILESQMDGLIPLRRGGSDSNNIRRALSFMQTNRERTTVAMGDQNRTNSLKKPIKALTAKEIR